MRPHVVLFSCKDQLLAKWCSVHVIFGTIVESFTPWNMAKDGSKPFAAVFFSQHIFRWLILVLSNKIQSLSQFLFLWRWDMLQLCEQDGCLSCYTAVSYFIVKENFLTNLIDHFYSQLLFGWWRVKPKLLPSLASRSSQQRNGTDGLRNWQKSRVSICSTIGSKRESKSSSSSPVGLALSGKSKLTDLIAVYRPHTVDSAGFLFASSPLCLSPTSFPWSSAIWRLSPSMLFTIA